MNGSGASSYLKTPAGDVEGIKIRIFFRVRV
jgi:hypothetical protein